MNAKVIRMLKAACRRRAGKGYPSWFFRKAKAAYEAQPADQKNVERAAFAVDLAERDKERRAEAKAQRTKQERLKAGLKSDVTKSGLGGLTFPGFDR